MKKFITPLLIFVLSLNASSQSFKKYAIADANCEAYFFCNPGKFDVSVSQDSSRVYTGGCESDSVSYGIICVKLFTAFDDLLTAENTLVGYLDYLKSSFNIVSAIGYGKGHRLRENEATRGVIDYWKDESKNNWKIKGWTNGKFIIVLFAYSLKALPESKVNVFLDGLVIGE